LQRAENFEEGLLSREEGLEVSNQSTAIVLRETRPDLSNSTIRPCSMSNTCNFIHVDIEIKKCGR
jgi:hypothetical protein